MSSAQMDCKKYSTISLYKHVYKLYILVFFKRFLGNNQNNNVDLNDCDSVRAVYFYWFMSFNWYLTFSISLVCPLHLITMEPR